ncbi:MAG: GNAT family N-acetyltransferase [Acidimicrobiales bacterium]
MDLRQPLRTDRLVLRALNASDLEGHHRLFSDPEVVRFLYDDVMDLGEAAAHLQRRSRTTLPGEGEYLNLAVEADGQFVGEVAVALTSLQHHQCEVGYVFDSRCRGRGFATEATARMVDLAFEELGAHRVAGRMDARNAASARVMERLGMRREAHLRENEFVKGEWTDEVVYATLAGEWFARARRQGVPR